MKDQEIEEILMKHSFKITEITTWSSFKKLNMVGAKRLAKAIEQWIKDNYVPKESNLMDERETND